MGNPTFSLRNQCCRRGYLIRISAAEPRQTIAFMASAAVKLEKYGRAFLAVIQEPRGSLNRPKPTLNERLAAPSASCELFDQLCDNFLTSWPGLVLFFRKFEEPVCTSHGRGATTLSALGVERLAEWQPQLIEIAQNELGVCETGDARAARVKRK